jgi:hypothetical protein
MTHDHRSSSGVIRSHCGQIDRRQVLAIPDLETPTINLAENRLFDDQ